MCTHTHPTAHEAKLQPESTSGMGRSHVQCGINVDITQHSCRLLDLSFTRTCKQQQSPGALPHEHQLLPCLLLSLHLCWCPPGSVDPLRGIFWRTGLATLGIRAVSACTHGCNHRRFSCRTLYKKAWEKTEPCLCKEWSGGAGKRSAIYHECPFYLQTRVRVSYGQKPLWPQVCSVWIIVWKGPLTSRGGLSRG